MASTSVPIMVNCSRCEGIEEQFGRKTAERELRRYRRKGPHRSTQFLIDMLRPYASGSSSLLDVGGGVGAIHHALLDEGVTRAIQVDVSAAYLRVAEDESTVRRHAARVQLIHGDLVQISTEVPAADLVTLDRVICCYPDLAGLLGTAADKARVALGVVYPRDKWWMRVAVKGMNGALRVRRSAFRVFVHPTASVEGVLRARGFERVGVKRTAVWEVALYRARSGRQ